MEKATLKYLPSETEEDGQERLAQVQYLSKKNTEGLETLGKSNAEKSTL